MVRKIEEIRTEIGIDSIGEAPKRVYKYAAYKDGRAEVFDDVVAAKQFSKNYEKIVDFESGLAYDTWWANYKAMDQAAATIWKNELRNEHPQFNDAVFELIYARAYETGHSAGYDEVANEFDIAADFVADIIKAM